MNDSDIEFSVGLDISPTEQKLNEIQNKLKQTQTRLSNARVPSVSKNLDTQASKLSKIDEALNALLKGDPKNLTSSKLNSLQRRLDTVMRNLRKDSKLLGPAIDASKKTNEEKEAVEDITEQGEKQTRNLLGKVLILGKIISSLYLIKRIVSSIQSVWNNFAKLTGQKWANINEEKGFFSIDPAAALNANVDTTRPRLYAALRNLGGNAPVSKNALDEMAGKFTTAWQNAMSGKSVDTALAIDTERLNRYFGINLTPEALLAGLQDGQTATDMQLDILDKIQSNLKLLTELSDPERAQVESSIRGLLGDEMANALIAFQNRQLLLPEGDRKLFSQWLLQFGGSAVIGGRLVSENEGAVTALGNLKEALSILTNEITEIFSPAFTNFTKGLTKFVEWLNNKFNFDKQSEKYVYGTDKNPLTLSAFINEKNKFFGGVSGDIQSKEDRKADKELGKEFAQVVEKNRKTYETSNDIYEQFLVAFANQSEFRTGEAVERGEKLKAKSITDQWVGMIMSGKGFGQKYNNALLTSLANWSYQTKTGTMLSGKDALYQMLSESGDVPDIVQRLFYNPSDMNDVEIESAKNFLLQNKWIRALYEGQFGEGGALDLNENILKDPKKYIEYLLNPLDFINEETFFSAFKAFADSINAKKFENLPYNTKTKEIDGKIEVSLKFKDNAQKVLTAEVDTNNTGNVKIEYIK